MLGKALHRYIAVPLLLALAPSAAFAAAWTLPCGRSQLIASALYYETTELFDTNGDRQHVPQFAKYEINPFYEYGYTDRLTLGLSPFLHYLHQDSAGGDDSNFGLAETEAFARYALYAKDGTVLSVQPLIKLPSLYAEDNQPKAGRGNMDGELKLLGGTHFTLLGREHFAEAGAGYRHRLGSLGDQWKFEAGLGLNVADAWQVLPKLYLTRQAGDTNTSRVSVSGQNDYDLTKLQLTAVYQLNARYALEFGGFSHVNGNNTGAGGGVLTSLWVRW